MGFLLRLSPFASGGLNVQTGLVLFVQSQRRSPYSGEGAYMFLDFSWVAEPTAWGGLGTLILLEVVLGIDNLVFISILSSRLPEDKRKIGRAHV